MRFDLTFSPFAYVLVMLLALLFCRFWPSGTSAPAGAKPPKRQRERKPFAGLTRKPDCEACEQQAQSQPQTPGAPPPRMIVTRGRQRQVDTTGHFCPQATCAYHGRVNWGNIRANGHPCG